VAFLVTPRKRARHRVALLDRAQDEGRVVVEDPVEPFHGVAGALHQQVR
jgi:hypothetical protein